MAACPDAGACCRLRLGVLFGLIAGQGDRRRAVIEIGMGSVQIGECDVMGHMNVRHYVSRALEALDWLGLELGLAPAYAREHGAALVPADHHISFVREFPAGTPFSVHGGVVRHCGETLRLYQEIRNTAAGAVAATVITDAVLADTRTGARRHLPSDVANAAAPLEAAVPDYAAPRGLDFGPPREPLSLDRAVESSVEHGEWNSIASVAPETVTDILTRLKRKVEKSESAALVTSSGSRYFVRQLAESSLPNLTVLSHNEIPPDIKVRSRGVIE